MIGVLLTTLHPLDLNSYSKFIIITLRSGYDNATYSDSVVDKLTYIWRREAQIIGQPAKRIMKLVRGTYIVLSQFNIPITTKIGINVNFERSIGIYL